MERDLVLGRSRRAPVSLSPRDRSWHVQILGGSGQGKSALLESLIRQDILAGRGLCLLDPHGWLADDIIAWCASRKVDSGHARTVHVINAADTGWCASFNPLRLDGVSDPEARVDAMVDACAQVWGGEDPNRTPLLRKCLSAVFYVLALRGLTLVEATELVTSSDIYHVRRRLTENLPSPMWETFWRDSNDLKPSDFTQQFSSTTSRLSLFLKAPIVRRMLGQTSRTLDLRGIMDRGEILIVNLAAASGQLSVDNARLLGTLLISELFLQALGRDRAMAHNRPFTLYLDEAGEYVTDDVHHMLEQTRKFGLHVVLAHQNLSQLKLRSEKIYRGIRSGTQTKIIFGGLDDDDAEEMARHVFRSTFNLQRPKHILDKPVTVDDVPYWLDSESDTTSTPSTSSGGESTGWSSGTGSSQSATEHFLYDGLIPDYLPHDRNDSASTSASSSDSGSSSWSSSQTEGASHARGRSQTLRSVRQTLPTAVHSLDEEIHLAIVKLRTLSQQEAVVKRPNRPPVRMRPLDINPPLGGVVRSPAFIERSRVGSPFIAATADAEAEIAARLAQLRQRETHVPSDDEFFSEES